MKFIKVIWVISWCGIKYVIFPNYQHVASLLKKRVTLWPKEETGYTICVEIYSHFYVPKGPHIHMTFFKMEFLDHFQFFIYQAACQLMLITTNFYNQSTNCKYHHQCKKIGIYCMGLCLSLSIQFLH